MNLFVLSTFKLYNFRDLFELKCYLYKIYIFHVKLNSYEFTNWVYWILLFKLSSLTILPKIITIYLN